MDDAAREPGSEKRDPRLLAVFPGLMLGMLVAALDQTVVATSLPSIVSDVGGLSHLSWIVTAYVLAISVSTPLYGKLGDLYGRKRVYLIAMSIFLIGSVLCGAAQSMLALVLFRALQGLGAGGIVVNAQAIIGDLIPPAERGRYQGLMQSVFGLATVFGPLLGGVVTEHWGWRWVFYINVPACLITLLVIAVKLPPVARSATRPRIDWWGVVLLSSGTVSLILVTSWGGSVLRWASPQIAALAATTVVLLVAFVVVERRAVAPILPLRLFRNPVVRVVSPLAFTAGCMTLGATIFMPLFQQTVDGVSPTMSGLRMAPLWTSWTITSIVSGRIITKRGRYRIQPILGTLSLTLAMLALSRLDVGAGYLPQAAVLFIVGMSLGLISSTMVLAAQNAVDRADLGVATSTTTFSRTMGAATGVAVFGAIFAATLRGNLPPQLAARLPEGGGVGRGSDFVAGLPAGLRAEFLRSFALALHRVFLAGAVVGAIGFVLALNLRDVPLRRGRGRVAEQPTDAVRSMAGGNDSTA